MKRTLSERAILLVIISTIFIWGTSYHLLYPLPFYGYFSDPELAYIYSALELSNFGYVELTDHPGTFLQLFGALSARFLSIDFTDAFKPESIDNFRKSWFGISLVSILGSILLLRKITPNAAALTTSILLIFHDFYTLAYFGRFTPEGAFNSLYLPTCLLAYIQLTKQSPSTWKSVGILGILLGCATTIKITLWPVTVFIWILFSFTGEGKFSHKLKKLCLLAAASAGSYLILSLIFSENRSEQIGWFLSLINNSGRYGSSNDHGAFLPISKIIQYTSMGLSLQSYTTLLPPIILIGIAIRDIIKKSIPDKNRFIAGGFILCMAFHLLIYAKHPYQTKYLLPQTYLMLLFFIYRVNLKAFDLPKLFKSATLLLLLGVTANALANYHILHRVNLTRYAYTESKINESVERFNPQRMYLSLEVHYPLTAQHFAAREIKKLIPLLNATSRPAEIFRERMPDYSISQDGIIPIAEIAKDSLIITKRTFTDPRVIPIFEDPQQELFIYYSQ